MNQIKSIPALDWIVSYLERHDIPYLMCGGLAAQAYGSARPLADIDLYVPDQFLNQVSAMGRDYVSFGPAHYVDEKWDLTFVQFVYEGQKIEVGSDRECKILDSRTGEWHKKNIDFDRYNLVSLYGKLVRVMKKDDLIAYKLKLSREVDLDDISQIGAQPKMPSSIGPY